MSHSARRFLKDHSCRSILMPSVDPFELRGIVVTPRAQSVELLVADSIAPVGDSQLRASWSQHSARRHAPLILAVAHAGQVSLCGPDADGLPSTRVFDLAQAEDLCTGALTSGDWSRLLGMFRGAAETQIVVTPAAPVTAAAPARARRETGAGSELSDAHWRRRRNFFEWSEFLLGQTHVLSRHPEMLPQQAANQPSATAPARAAAAWSEREGKRRPWFRLLNPPEERSACVSVLSAHSGSVTACAFLPEGDQLVSASLDGTLKSWDVATGRMRMDFETGGMPVRSCALSPDGKWIAGGGDDGELHLWSTAGGGRSLLARRAGVSLNACAFSPDARQVAAGYSDGVITIIDLATRTMIAELTGSTIPVSCCGFSPRAEWLIVAAGGALLRWAAHRPAEAVKLREHDRAITVCAISPDERWIVSAAGREVKLTSLDGTHKRSMKLRADLLSARFSPDGHWFAAAHGPDIEVMDARKEDGPRHALRGHTAEISTCEFSPDGRLFASCSRDGSIRLWLVERIPSSEAPLERKTISISCVSLDGHKVAAASGSELTLWEHEQKTTYTVLPEISGPVTACDFSPNGWILAAAMEPKTVRVWRSHAPGPVLKGHRASVSCCVFSPDGRFLATASADHTLRVWDATNWSHVATLEGHEAAVNVALFQVGKEMTVISASDDCTIRHWNLSGKETSRRQGHSGPIHACAISPDYRLLASASDDGSVRIWTRESERATSVLEGHGSPVRSCGFSGDGRWLFSHADDRNVRVWDTTRFTLHATIASTGSPSGSTAFAADSEHLVLVTGDGTVLWNVQGRAEKARFFGDGRTESLRWTQSGYLAMGTDSGALHLLAVENLGAMRLTAWREASGWNPFKGKPKEVRFGCPRCRTWSAIEGDALGNEIECASCHAAIRLNPFQIESDWTPVAGAWSD